MFQTILVGTDGSGHAGRAVEVAAAIAAQFEARLVVLSVVQSGPVPEEIAGQAHRRDTVPPHPLLANIPSWFDDALDATRKGTGEAHVLIEALARGAVEHALIVAEQAGISAPVTVLEHGDPAEIILALAEREDADLIVLGRRGLGRVAELLLGSVSHKVAQQSDRCCLTVR